MSKEFQLARGIHVSDLSGIAEGYAARRMRRGHTAFVINVSAGRLVDVVRRLSSLVAQPGFLVIDVPFTARPAGAAPDDAAENARDVYYLDRLDHAGFSEIFEAYSGLLLHDGMINFGYGSLARHDEVFVAAYKIVKVFSVEPKKYERALAGLGFNKRQKLKTVWDNISAAAPGRKFGLEIDGRRCEDVLAELKQRGLYFAERRDRA
jgi:hypothetical protein